jgi:hypothetical protein
VGEKAIETDEFADGHGRWGFWFPVSGFWFSAAEIGLVAEPETKNQILETEVGMAGIIVDAPPPTNAFRWTISW